MRCGTSGTSWHVTIKSSIRDLGVLYKSGNRANIRPAKQLWLPLYIKGEVFASKAEFVFPIGNKQLMGLPKLFVKPI